jgi:DksA/TraR C4-type zinc finger protein
MSDNRTIHLVEIPIGGSGGSVWNRLHGEREDTCETLARISGPDSDIYRELLHARLRKLDAALDRLMSGSYGNCSQCGLAINETRLDVDPATSLCLDCSGISEKSSTATVLLAELQPFDTILLGTHNSDYRILLLDPKTGRALVEGGSYLLEPSEAFIIGSGNPGSAFNGGAICIGDRLEMCVHEKMLLTSPVKSVEVKQNAGAESLETISSALH